MYLSPFPSSVRRAALLPPLLAAAAVAGEPPPAFPDARSLDPAIPAPAAALGHPVGDTAVRYETMWHYLEDLAEASNAVTLAPYAQSHEGRTLGCVTITSPANHARLEAIRADNARLADPRGLAEPDAERILRGLPGVAWLAYSIHGDELSSTDAAVQVAYQLAAGTDEATRRLREELVIHIDPPQNPDGRERYLSQLQTLTGRVPNPDYQAMQHAGLWSAGRGNHYLFDLNRDWLMQVHPETRGRAAAILAWNPHLLVDSHEMGSLETYLFDPPREPWNMHLSESNLGWRRRFSADQAAAFDRRGWSYYTQEWYEEWYPGYTNAWANLLGSVGLLYEQAGVNAASVRQRSGETLTYREAVTHQVVSTLANLETLRVNRAAVLRDFLADRRFAVSADGPFDETFLLPPSGDAARRRRFVEILERQGIEHTTARAPIEARDVADPWGTRTESRTFPAETLVVGSAQPHRRLMHAILGFDPHMSEAFLEEERKELERRRGSRIYDVTAWSLPLAFGLEAYWARQVAPAAAAPAPAPAGAAPAAPPATPPAYGWLLDGRSANVHAALVRLMEAGAKPRVASRAFAVGGHRYLPGAVLLRRHENPQDLDALVRRIGDDLDLEVRPAETALCAEGPDLGGERFFLLEPPRVAVASQWPVAPTSFGSTWYLLDARLGMRSSPINVQNLGDIDLRAYNVLVLPDTWSDSALRAVLDDGALARIRRWIESGGTLVALGGSAAFLADEKPGISAVRRRSDVLERLEVYAEAVGREKAARRIDVEPSGVWGTEPGSAPAAGEGGAARDGSAKDGAAPSKPDVEALKRADEWEAMFSPQGVFAAARLDPEHWLCAGLDERVAVLVGGTVALMSKHPVQTPARLEEAGRLRLSGLLWPEARARFADTAYATVERLGDGQVVLFLSDPFFRGYTEGSGRMLANAVLLGPGMGASQPVPW